MTQGKTRADAAEALFREGYNCAQSVFAAFHDVVGMDEAEALRISSAFGAGFGKLREVCGAVSGMAMVLGCMRGYDDAGASEDKAELYALTQKLVGEFSRRQGSCICREMLGLAPGEDLPEPPVRDEAYYAGRPCLAAVRDAADIVQAALEIPDPR